MMFEPIARKSASTEVFDQITARVLGGDLAAGESLPSERRLAEAFGVSRPAVREAIQKLAQAGLVEVRQGDATSVRDFRQHGGPELLSQLLIRNGQPDWPVVRSVLEARRMIGTQVARLAAGRATPDAAAAVQNAAEALAAASDPVSQQVHALTFWERVVDAADSIAFRLIFNSLRNAYEPTMAAMAGVMVAEVGRSDLYHALADAVAAHDEDTATGVAATLLDLGTAAVTTAIDQLQQQEQHS
ncbi:MULTISPECIES: FadR/GntR family transcriptional regulator [Rhodococcus]|uniref:GntR family transcriptional regulator n=1 Tax=Rhodococcus oxybenzonivorans TaxID=1990687 RepID=A0AAE4UVM4_9NOCA|nr:MULTISPECIES: GntR family transcriptional regulator [Rhodococcus]MDV7244120.1 GntR family transcriptional regulator [Rhodococcus oxybenzonivorans]MDV7263099.1 GntR family transcriptional regulator [Rhodococcus oxybenzonivorans]MDV7274638.1 GntR family transcriptional regulator [Rhodococcus oxybenzonivorans]MDV7335951.1 GntR family transcriptional regulator [Rhodococcus oxybenzonivorans]MDV7345588.1 GntR family transcriptional regulator [Rhodococcus oxybenzonivorans]